MKIVNSFKDIKKTNDKYIDNGVFYKKIFKKQFIDGICKEYFSKVYNSRNLYDVIDNFYGYNSNQNYFDISQGNR